MPKLIRVEARRAHRLYVEFSDGVAGEVDLSSRLFGPMFVPLRDESVFAQVALDEFGAPCWPTGADLAPDGLYARVQLSASDGVAPPLSKAADGDTHGHGIDKHAGRGE